MTGAGSCSIKFRNEARQRAMLAKASSPIETASRRQATRYTASRFMSARLVTGIVMAAFSFIPGQKVQPAVGAVADCQRPRPQRHSLALLVPSGCGNVDG